MITIPATTDSPLGQARAQVADLTLRLDQLVERRATLTARRTAAEATIAQLTADSAPTAYAAAAAARPEIDQLTAALIALEDERRDLESQRQQIAIHQVLGYTAVIETARRHVLDARAHLAKLIAEGSQRAEQLSGYPLDLD